MTKSIDVEVETSKLLKYLKKPEAQLEKVDACLEFIAPDGLDAGTPEHAVAALARQIAESCEHPRGGNGMTSMEANELTAKCDSLERLSYLLELVVNSELRRRGEP